MTITLNIERMTLEGVDWEPAQQAQFRGAFETELARLLAAHGPLPKTGRTVPRVRAPDAELEQAPTPAAMGRQAAQSVFEGLRVG